MDKNNPHTSIIKAINNNGFRTKPLPVTMNYKYIKNDYKMKKILKTKEEIIAFSIYLKNYVYLLQLTNQCQRH